MIGIILTVLKVIGIILLVILGILLLLLLLALFVPVRYTAGVKSDDNVKVYVKASYLLHILSFLFEYDKDKKAEPTTLMLKVFGKKINLDKAKKEPKKDKAKETPKDEAVPETTPEPVLIQKEPEGPEEEAPENIKKISKEELEAEAKEEETKAEEPDFSEPKTFSETPEKPNFKDKASELKEKAKDLIEKGKSVYEELSDERNQAAFSHFIKSIKHILKCYMPKKLRGEGVYSLGDPANTGKVLGALYLLPPVLRQELEINNADFESDRAYFKGEVYLKGHIRLNHVAAEGIGILFDKNCRRFIKRTIKRRK
ncbi:MAG: hypothetical protein K6E56_05320 [Lachnospiraceae bacterium]|nr:hypothetical protein [Lachnospiraceae bacterium]